MIDDPGPNPVELEMPTAGDHDGDDAQSLRKLHRTRWIVATTLFVGLGYVGLAIASPSAIDRAKADWSRCTETETYEPCSLEVPLFARVTFSAARQHERLQATVRYDNAKRAIRRAVHVEFDAAARDAAAATLLREHAAGRYAIGDVQPHAPLDTLASLGAHAAVVSGTREGLKSSDPIDAPLAALALGDLPAVGELWDRPLNVAYERYDLERGAWRCLLGDATGAEYDMREAVVRGDYPRENARLTVAVFICSGAGEAYEAATINGPVWAGPDGAWIIAREAANARQDPWMWLRTHESQPRPLQILAQAVMRRDRELDLEALRDWFERRGAYGVPDTEFLAASRGFFDLHGPDRHAVYAPQTMLTAATQLAALAWERKQTASEDLPEPEPESESASETEPEPESESESEPSPDPRDVGWLRTGAGLMAAEAALEFVRRGQTTQAHQAALLARDLLPASLRWIALGPLWLSGGSEAALTLILELREHADLTPETAQVLDELELRALTQLGRFDEALARVRVLDRADKDPDVGEPPPVHAGVLRTWHRALAVQLGEPLPDHGRHDAELDNPDLAVILEIERVGLTGAEHAKIETWLDTRMLTRLDAQGRSAMWARAEAARWRGDAETEARWRERLAAVNALADTNERALLLDFAGF